LATRQPAERVGRGVLGMAQGGFPPDQGWPTGLRRCRTWACLGFWRSRDNFEDDRRAAGQAGCRRSGDGCTGAWRGRSSAGGQNIADEARDQAVPRHRNGRPTRAIRTRGPAVDPSCRIVYVDQRPWSYSRKREQGSVPAGGADSYLDVTHANRAVNAARSATSIRQAVGVILMEDPEIPCGRGRRCWTGWPPRWPAQLWPSCSVQRRAADVAARRWTQTGANSVVLPRRGQVARGFRPCSAHRTEA